MKKYYGHYLGVCICNNDPEKRGRVQVFVPHIMPGLYENWNDSNNDISINCVGDNLIDGIPSNVIYKLSKILPWAEAASPIVGTSSPGNLLQQVAEAASGAYSAAKGIIGKVFDQSPAAEPAEIGSMQELFNKAGSFNTRGVNASKLARNSSRDGLCGIGARSMIGAMTDDKYFANGLGGGRQSYASSLSLGGGNSYLQNSGYYNAAVQAPSTYFSDKSQWQVGDVITSGGGGGDGKGHIQVWTGTAWVSDHTQNRIYSENSRGSYNNFTLHRANEKGQARMQQTVGSLVSKPASQSTAKEATSVSGEVAAASPHQSATPINTDSSSPQYANIANPNTNVALDINTKPADVGLLAVDSNGYVDPNNMKSYLEQRIASSKLNGYVPADAAKYGVDGSPKSWANYFTKLAEKESGFEAGQRYQESFNNSKGERVVSTGLFQVSYESVRGYGVGKGLSDSQLDQKLSDPAYNIDAAIAIHEKQVLRSGTIAMPSGKGAGGYFASASMRKIAADVAAGKVDQFNASASPSGPRGTSGTNMINNSDPHGTTITQNLNGMAKGLFTYPAAGAMLWVFFREGNPMFPVYFAASYSQEEWKSAYRYGSDGPGYRPASTPDNPTTSTGGVMNLNGVGGLRWEDTNNPEDRLQDQKSIMFFGEDGSNIFMGKGYNQYFSKFDRRDQVEGDRWNSTLGFKEEWIQGDSNSVTMGDVIVKVGNVSQPAVDAVQRIQQLISECQAPLSETSGSGSSSNNDTETKQNHNSAKQAAFKKELEKIEHENSDRYTMSPSEFASKHGLKAVGRFPSPNTASAPSQTLKSFTNAGTISNNALPSGPINVPQGALRSANTPT